MALSKLSGDEQGLLFVQLCNVKRRTSCSRRRVNTPSRSFGKELARR
jgi:hypothetical protein